MSRSGLVQRALLVCLCAFHLGAAPAAASHEAERCRAAAEKGDAGLPLPYRPTASQEPVHLRVAGVRYAIPANYFRYPPIGCDTEEDVLLRVLLPTFEGWSKERDRQLRGAPGEPYLGMNILLENLAEPVMDRAFQAFAGGADPNGDYAEWHSLMTTKNSDGYDVFFERENASVSFLMVCKTLEQFPYPTCGQHFQYRGAHLQLTFSRRKIAAWVAIRDGTLSLLDRFVQAASPANASQEEQDGTGSDLR